MDIYDNMDWAGILRSAAESLENEGRHNQGSVLKQAATHIDHLREAVEALRTIANGNPGRPKWLTDIEMADIARAVLAKLDTKG
jgi:predicted urease superfamily metal-dependent hydrolase